MTDDGSLDRPLPVRHIACDLVVLDELDGVWTLGFARTEPSGDTAEYLMFQSPLAGNDGWGTYIETDDQSHSGYDLVRKVTVGNGMIEFTLTKGLGPGGAMRFVMTFADTTENRATIDRGLKRVFEDKLNALLSDQA